jgi:hypothetical protein
VVELKIEVDPLADSLTVMQPEPRHRSLGAAVDAGAGELKPLPGRLAVPHGNNASGGIRYAFAFHAAFLSFFLSTLTVWCGQYQSTDP